jgi:hypothetical protein
MAFPEVKYKYLLYDGECSMETVLRFIVWDEPGCFASEIDSARVYYVSFFVKGVVDWLFAVVITVVLERGDALRYNTHCANSAGR